MEVLVVGCGRNGSAIAAGLPYLHSAMLPQGHPYGLHVTVIGGDTVSPFNCVRQPFTRSEIGLSKAVVLVNRVNLFWGGDYAFERPTLVINWVCLSAEPVKLPRDPPERPQYQPHADDDAPHHLAQRRQPVP